MTEFEVKIKWVCDKCGTVIYGYGISYEKAITDLQIKILKHVCKTDKDKEQDEYR